MNVFNRLVVIFDILLTMVIVTLLLVLPVDSLTTIVQWATGLMQMLSRIHTDYIILTRALLIVVAILVDFLLLLLLIAEVRGPRQKWIRVPSVTGGNVSMRLDSIAARLRYHIDPLPDVLSVKPRVSPKRNGVHVSLEVEALSEINVPRKAEEIIEVARQVIEEKMGLKLAGKPQVMVRTVYPPEGARPATTSVVPSPPPAAFKPSTPAEPPAAPSGPESRQ